MTEVLIITAHPDDELLSCGGLIIQESGRWKMDVCVVTDKGPRWLRRFRKACDVMGVRRAVSLDIPLWTDKDRRELNLFSADEFVGRLAHERMDLRGYEMIITHNPDGDIDRHPQHAHLARLVIDAAWERNLWHFVAFPRYGVKRTHPLHDEYRRVEWWRPHLEAGFLPPELAERADKVCTLRSDTVKLKMQLKRMYMGPLDKYPMIRYPMELFAASAGGRGMAPCA